MENFKKAQVILLPTDNILQNGLQPYSVYSKPITKGGWTIPKSGAEARRLYQNGNQAYHLYIVSEDEIKDGDTCLYNKNCNSKNPDWELVKCGIIEREEMHPISNGRLLLWMTKVIATTDSSLKVSKFSHYSKNLLKVPVYKDECLPQPSQQFIEHYIEAYNKSEIIKDVLVEYELDKVDSILCQGECGICDDSCNIVFKVKVNQDNTINIKSIKDSWNREEVIEFGNKIREYCKDGWKQDSLHRVFFEWDKFINENL